VDEQQPTTLAAASGGGGKQLCQGHCPVQQVATRFPQLCEAETKAFSELLGVHVQRLATLAHGEHVCTTHVPLAARPAELPDPRFRPEPLGVGPPKLSDPPTNVPPRHPKIDVQT